jgi:hypothetical protein
MQGLFGVLPEGDGCSCGVKAPVASANGAATSVVPTSSVYSVARCLQDR